MVTVCLVFLKFYSSSCQRKINCTIFIVQIIDGHRHARYLPQGQSLSSTWPCTLGGVQSIFSGHAYSQRYYCRCSVVLHSAALVGSSNRSCGRKDTMGMFVVIDIRGHFWLHQGRYRNMNWWKLCGWMYRLNFVIKVRPVFDRWIIDILILFHRLHVLGGLGFFWLAMFRTFSWSFRFVSIILTVLLLFVLMFGRLSRWCLGTCSLCMCHGRPKSCSSSGRYCTHVGTFGKKS